MRTLYLVLLLCATVAVAQTPGTIADIAGDGSAHAVAASGNAGTITFCSPPSNATTNCGATAISGCVRIGDSNISTTRGMYLVPGACGYLPWSRYQLNQWYYLAQVGDKVVISYVQ